MPLDIELREPFDIGLCQYRGGGRIPRVRRTIDWLVEAFDSAGFPWVKDRLIQPGESKAVYKGEPLPHLFGGF